LWHCDVLYIHVSIRIIKQHVERLYDISARSLIASDRWKSPSEYRIISDLAIVFPHVRGTRLGNLFRTSKNDLFDCILHRRDFQSYSPPRKRDYARNRLEEKKSVIVVKQQYIPTRPANIYKTWRDGFKTSF